MEDKIFKCRLCACSDYQTIFETAMPLSGQYSINGEENNKYPLHLVFCKNCGHIQLANDTPADLYNNYLYTPSYSNEFQNYITKFVAEIDEEFKNCTDKTVVEIGSSNGSLLKKFQDKNWKVLGIEPSKTLADAANKNGVDTLNDYFGTDSIETIHERVGIPNVIIMRHVLEHLDDLPDLVSALSRCVYPKEDYCNQNVKMLGGGGGRIYIEVPYVKREIEEK